MGNLANNPGVSRIAASIAKSVASAPLDNELGKVLQISADKIVARTSNCSIGDQCLIIERQTGRQVQCQVISIEGDNTILSPVASVDGLSVNSDVINTGSQFLIQTGDFLIGRVVDGLCKPLDHSESFAGGRAIPVRGSWLSPLERTVIDETFETGVRSVDLFNTVGLGQRMAILGEPGAGKSTLISMLARHSEADVVVIAMIGERGREVREFLDRQLPPKVRSRCVTVVATSDRSPLERVMAGHTAMAIAEDFRERGKNVLMLFDSVTRFARALREVGLAAGEQPVRQGYTPSVYTELPRLLERCGKTRSGSITGFFSVLLENEGVNDAISEEVMSLTDGHIKLDAKLAQSGHYPAVDILKSKSRLMRELVASDDRIRSDYLKSLAAKYLEVELLVQVGEYVSGTDLEADAAIKARPSIRELTCQALEEQVPIRYANEQMKVVVDDLRTEQDEAA